MKTLTLRIKILLLVIGMLLALIVISTGITLSKLDLIGKEIKEITEEGIPLTKIITEITIHQLEQAIHFERAIRFGMEMKSSDAAARNFQIEKKAFHQLGLKVDDEINEGEKIAQEAINLSISEASKKEFKNIFDHLKIIEQKHAQYESHVFSIFNDIAHGIFREYEEIVGKVEAEEDQLDYELENFLREVEKFTEESILRTEEEENTVSLMMRGITFFALIFGISISLVLVFTSFNKPLFVGIERVESEMKEIIQDDIPLTKIITEIAMGQLGQVIWFERALRLALELKETNEVTGDYTNAKEKFHRLSNQVEDKINKGVQVAEEAINVVITEVSRKEFKDVLRHLKIIEQEHTEYVNEIVAVFEKIAEGQFDAADEIRKIEEKEEALRHKLENLLRKIENFTEASILQTEKEEKDIVSLIKNIS